MGIIITGVNFRPKLILNNHDFSLRSHRDNKILVCQSRKEEWRNKYVDRFWYVQSTYWHLQQLFLLIPEAIFSNFHTPGKNRPNFLNLNKNVGWDRFVKITQGYFQCREFLSSRIDADIAPRQIRNIVRKSPGRVPSLQFSFGCAGLHVFPVSEIVQLCYIVVVAPVSVLYLHRAPLSTTVVAPRANAKIASPDRVITRLIAQCTKFANRVHIIILNYLAPQSPLIIEIKS